MRHVLMGSMAVLGVFVVCVWSQVIGGELPEQPRAAAAPLAGGMPWTEWEVQWSSPVMTRAPKGDVTFHGAFANETVYVTSATPAAHEFVEVSLDLLILRTWDGSVNAEVGGEMPTLEKALGPDYFRLGVLNGPTLMYTTFSNAIHANIRDESKAQNYPSPVPGDHLEPMSGAVARNTLGYNYPWTEPERPYPMDATYAIRFVVPHRDASATFELSGMNLQNIADESWGAANLRIRAVAAADVPHPSEQEIQQAFRQALDPKAANGPQAFQTLIFGMDDTTRWIRNHAARITVRQAAVQEQIANMLAGDGHADKREAARDVLVSMGHGVEPALRDARRTAPAEGRARIDWALQMLGVKRIADEDTRQVALATRVLEIIGTPEALHVRESLTNK